MAIRTMGPSGQYETGLDAAGAALPELLAPAGGLDQMLAAIAAGADAIYAGLGGFNARVSAHGFTDDEFARGCAVAHAHGVRVYVTLNVFVFDDELSDAVALGAHALELGADALIVADAGLACALRAAIPGVEIHLSTQAGAHSEGAVRLAADELGVERVTTARELTVDEIASLCGTGVPIEVFCHGAICIGYSGACEFSALRRGRSAMRGECTQPCRLAYDLVDEAGQSVVAVEGDRLLCPRDYLGIAHLPELVDAGVASLKIEGRMKNPDYVFNVVRVWRRALDMLCDGAWDPGAVEELERELGRSFNRGFTDAYLRGRSGAELMSFERAINQGVRVGRLVAVGHEEVTVELDAAVAAGDTLEIRFYPGADARPDVPKRWPQVPCPVDAAAGKRVVVHCKRKVDAGCEVYLIRSAGVLGQTATVLERMRAEADAIAPVARAVEVLPFEDVAVDGGASTELVECTAHARMVFAWQLMDADPRGELDLSDAAVVLDEVCRTGDADRTRSLTQRAGRVVCRNLGQVVIARELGVTFDVAAPVFCANRATLAWLRELGAGRVYLPAELLGNDAERIAELAAEPGVWGPVDADRPELMVCEHCLLTAEGVCATDATGQVRCRDCLRRRQVRYLVERDGTRLPVAVDACGRTRIFLSWVPRRVSLLSYESLWTSSTAVSGEGAIAKGGYPMLSVDEQMRIITSGAAKIVPEADLRKKLEKGEPLNIKLGVDPTSPDLHLGHAVPLRKMRQFQDLGHNVTLIIGNGTALIGDPSGKNSTRPQLSQEQIEANAETYVSQAMKILDPEKTTIVHNGDWILSMDLAGLLQVCSKFTVARILERDDFTKRYQSQTPIALHEFLYPVMQAFDSVQIKADVEMGGTDQLFNLLAGRELMEKMGMEPQIALTMPLLEGTDGVRKMSKSYGNYIGLTDAPKDMFGKTMSIPDEMIGKYYRLASSLTPAEVDKIDAALADGSADPYELKRALGRDLCDTYHGAGAGDEAQAEFDRVFKEGQLADFPEKHVELTVNDEGQIYLAGLLKDLGLSASAGQARRDIDGGGVKINGEAVAPKSYNIDPSALKLGDTLSVGKRKGFKLI